MHKLHVNTNQAVKSVHVLQLVDQQWFMLHQLTLISHGTRILLPLCFLLIRWTVMV